MRNQFFEHQSLRWMPPGIADTSEHAPLFQALSQCESVVEVVRVLYPTNVRREICLPDVTLWLYLLDPNVPPGPAVIYLDVDLTCTSVISVQHPDVKAAYESLDARLRRIDPERRAHVRDVIFARNRLLDTTVPRINLQLHPGPETRRPA